MPTETPEAVRAKAGAILEATPHTGACGGGICLCDRTIRAMEAYRNEGIEDAAKVAEAHQTNGKRLCGRSGPYDDAAQEIAAAIRALAAAGIARAALQNVEAG